MAEVDWLVASLDQLQVPESRTELTIDGLRCPVCKQSCRLHYTGHRASAIANGFTFTLPCGHEARLTLVGLVQ